MKFIYIVCLLVCAALADQLIQFELDDEVKTVLEESVVTHFVELAEKLAALHNKHAILGETTTANLNDYVDALLSNINEAILNAGLDPTTVPDESISIGIGTSTLSHGNLTKLSTIERYHNVTVSYDPDDKKASIEFILRWEDLELIYKYHTKVVLISMTGHVTANVEHLKIHLKLGYDFNANQITIDDLDFNHTGDIKLTFSGNSLLDYISDAMTTVFTTIFHNLIMSIVKEVAMDPVESIVTSLNEIIDKALNPDNYVPTLEP